MDTTEHNLATLFQQLGLASDDASIEKFFAEHSLDSATELAEASFWNESQRQFIRESMYEDADWAELIDMLDARLRH